jgi:hypothetical protein
MISFILENSPMQMDDPYFLDLINQEMEAFFNDSLRREIYYEIQEYICEDIVP